MLKFLVPPFIKNIDKTLVLNYPFWYIVKLHYILYFTIIFWIISYGIGCLLPIDISSYNPENVTNTWTFVFAVLAIILFCVWMYYLTIYNNEDRFGKFTMWDDVKLLAVLLIGINLLMSFSYPMQIRVKTRLANSFSDAELAKQYNDLNLGHKYINSDLTNYQYCGYNIHDVVAPEQLAKDTDEFGQQRFVYDLSKYKSFLHFSPETIGHYDYSFSNFFFGFSALSPSSEFKHSFYSEYKIEQEYRLHKTDEQKLNAIKKYFDVLKLYRNSYSFMMGHNIVSGSDYPYQPQDYLDNYNHYEKTCLTYFPNAFNLSANDKQAEMNYLPFEDATHNMVNIYQAKFSNIYLLKNSYLMFAFYFSFYVSILIILFRNNTWQHYIVSIVSFILLGIIIGLSSLIIGYRSENSFFTLALLTWIAIGVISIWYYLKHDKYRVVGAVASNLFYFSLPLMPLLFCLYLHETFDWLKCYADYNDPIASAQCEIIRMTYQDVIFWAQIGGISSFILIVMPFYKVFFAQQKALPREK